MSWIRCKACRTLVNPGGHRFCMGCGAAVPESAAGAGLEIPEVERQTRRDSSTGTALVLVFALIGMTGAVLLALSAQVSPVLRGVLVAGVVVIAVTGVLGFRSRDRATGIAAKSALGLLAVIGALLASACAVVIGGLILLLVLCAVRS